MKHRYFVHRFESSNQPTHIGDTVNAVTYCGIKVSYTAGDDPPKDFCWLGNHPKLWVTKYSCEVCERLGTERDERIKIIVDNLAKGIYPK